MIHHENRVDMIAGMNGVRAFCAQMRRQVGIGVRSCSSQIGYATVVISCRGDMGSSVAAIERRVGP